MTSWSRLGALGALALLLSGLGCSGARHAGRDHYLAPPPFSADEIRDATAPGRTYRFRVDAPGRPAVVRQMRFASVDDEGCVIEVTMYDGAGARVGEPQARRQTWAQLVGHASYPRSWTTVSEVQVEVPAGRFAAKLYEVRDDTERAGWKVTRAWFATSLPGAPVKLVVREGGEVVSRMELLKHAPGGG